MHKTTVVLDEGVLEEARKVIVIRTKREAIKAGLCEIVKNWQGGAADQRGGGIRFTPYP